MSFAIYLTLPESPFSACWLPRCERFCSSTPPAVMDGHFWNSEPRCLSPEVVSLGFGHRCLSNMLEMPAQIVPQEHLTRRKPLVEGMMSPGLFVGPHDTHVLGLYLNLK